MPGTALVHRLPFFCAAILLPRCVSPISFHRGVCRQDEHALEERNAMHNGAWSNRANCSILFHCENASCSEDERSFMLRERWT